MPLSVVDLYKSVLPKTNCGDCGYPTCLAFASMVVADSVPLKRCPHVDAGRIDQWQKELDAQHAAGKWTRRDMAADALQWARSRAASMDIADLPERIGGELIRIDGVPVLKLPYFNQMLHIRSDALRKADGSELTRWEQVFIYNHLAQGGRRRPTGKWKGLVELPNTISKVKSMTEHVEAPLIECFSGNPQTLEKACVAIGGHPAADDQQTADVAMVFNPLPRIPVMLLFWDQDEQDGYDAQVKLLFDETIVEHLDIESILFLSERLRQLLCEFDQPGDM